MKLRSTLFENLIVFISPNADVDESFRKQLAEHGAVVALNVNKRITHVVCIAGDKDAKVLEARKHEHVYPVTKDFFLESLKVKSLRMEDSFLPDGEGLANTIKKIKKSKKSNNGLQPDEFCKLTNVSVYIEGETKWRCILNLTDLTYSVKGSNKFYIMQLLESHDKTLYHVWIRYGRVGYNGSTNTTTFRDPDSAKDEFMNKFYKKSGNNWDERDNFSAVSGKYTLISHGHDEEEENSGDEDELEEETKPLNTESKLDGRLQDLIKLIFDNTMMKDTVSKMNYDVKKQPLGKLPVKNIRQALEVLKELEDYIKNDPTNRVQLNDLSNRFYTLIPHSFGHNKPPCIDNLVMLEQKIELLDTLNLIDKAKSLIREDNQFGDASIHPLDRKYKQLELNMKVIEKNEQVWDVLNRYIQNTHAPTHTNYTLTLLDAFELDREDEKTNYIPFDNQMLLFHGSRLSNYVGILSKGLRIAPPEAPSTGYMFGKGVYFADLSSKSANYCIAGNKDKVGLLLLCQVSLGEMLEKTSAMFIKSLPKKFQSVKGVGQTEPNPNDFHMLEDNVKVPYGQPTLNSNVKKSDLLYNEYIVYDTNQIIFKYLLKVRFNYK